MRTTARSSIASALTIATAIAWCAPAHAADDAKAEIDTKNLTTLPNAENAPPKPSVEEAPPPPPHHKGAVLASSIGALGFAGQFRKVAPPGVWLDLHGGYEIFDFSMVFLETELAYTTTENAQDPPKTHAFPLFGFGAGVRGTVHFLESYAVFLEGNLGLMKADIAKGALANIGYKDAESFNPYFGGHLGVERYMVDRHLAISLFGGARDLTGFKRQIGGSDTPLAWDGAIALRYTF